MSSLTSPKSSRKRIKKRPPVKLTVKIPSPEKKRKKMKSESLDFDDHDYTCTVCDFCSKSFGDGAKLLSHMRKSHRQGSHICMCHGKLFKTRRSMQSHEEKMQDGTMGQRKNYRKYTQEALLNAYNAVKEGKMSTRKAAKKFSIPFTTLLDRVAGRFEVNTYMATSGPRPLISRDDEQKLCLHVQFMAAIGYTYLRTTVTQLATELATFKCVLDEGKSLSDNWYRKFVNRWPELSKKPKGASAVSPASTEVVKKYYQEYVQTLTTHGIEGKPENIYCLTVYELNIQKYDQNQGKKKCSGNKVSDMVSIILCSNAAGSSIAPFFVFSGGAYSDKLMEGSLPNSQARVSPSGVMDSSMFKDYFKNHLLKLLKADMDVKEGPVLVTYNGHLIHFEIERIEWARKHGVLLFALPPVTDHLKSSLDSEMKDMFHQLFKQEAKKYQKKHFGDPLTKYNVWSVVRKVFPQVFTKRILIRFFKNAGIYPVVPELVDPEVTYADVEDLDESVYDDLESTEAFLQVRLPFPNVANRVLLRRNGLPLQTSNKMLERFGQPSKKDEKAPLKLATTEHSYVHGVVLSQAENETDDTVAVKPIIDVPHSSGPLFAPDPATKGVKIEDTDTVEHVISEVTTASHVGVEDPVLVIETQVVSSVVEVGTTELIPVIDLAGGADVGESQVQEFTVRTSSQEPGSETDPDQPASLPRYAYVVDPATKIKYKIMFTK
ncbi:uncharacterized protein [Haliotis cracherodii]|uniref:uncharacterized protein n=1 Tax=Haliotis cracherodii TaxID=6455 RepID=UPI0039ED034A